jgi:hypothetical protein
LFKSRQTEASICQKEQLADIHWRPQDQTDTQKTGLEMQADEKFQSHNEFKPFASGTKPYGRSPKPVMGERYRLRSHG